MMMKRIRTLLERGDAQFEPGMHNGQLAEISVVPRSSPNRGGTRKGAGRPRVLAGDARRVSFYLPTEMADFIDAEAARNGWSRSEALRLIVAAYRGLLNK